MKTFIALVHKDEDSAWGVSFPDLPGCFSRRIPWQTFCPRLAKHSNWVRG
jgi:hypothetical protein